MKRKMSSFVCFVLLPIVFGTAFYVLFCPEVRFVKMIYEMAHLQISRKITTNDIGYRLLRYYLMDFLWAFSLMAAVQILFATKKGYHRFFFLVLVFEIGMELAQLFPGIRGTFDICDIFVEALANILVIKILPIGGEEK
ncbi:MAG: hypothetical protein ACI4DU_05420 [Lachnospiraceae bacterium]